MRRKKRAIITYTTFDQKVREGKFSVWEDDKLLENIIEYTKTNEWPEEPADIDMQYLEWGLELQPSNPFLRTAFHSCGKLCPTKTQRFFYNTLLKNKVIGGLAYECMNSPDFAKAMLKEAAERAKKKDEEHIAWQIAHGYEHPNTHDFREALTRAEKRIRYHQTKPYAQYGDELKHFIPIIEEFELYTLLSFEICDSKEKNLQIE